MSTGPEGNGLTHSAAYPSRTQTFAAGDQVPSSTLNAVQDGLVLTSDQVATAYATMAPSTTSSKNQTDSPSPSTFGGKDCWIEAESNGLTEVVLDQSIDWRDRLVIVQGVVDLSSGLVFPGETGDAAIDDDINLHQLFYSHEGTAYPTAPTASAHVVVSGAEQLHVYVRDDGKLVMRMSPYTSAVARIMAKVSASPMQRHY